MNKYTIHSHIGRCYIDNIQNNMALLIPENNKYDGLMLSVDDIDMLTEEEVDIELDILSSNALELLSRDALLQIIRNTIINGDISDFDHEEIVFKSKQQLAYV